MNEDQRLYWERIVVDSRIPPGKPVVKYNPDIKDLLAVHPDLIRPDVQACLAYEKDVVIGAYQRVVRESTEENPRPLFHHLPFSTTGSQDYLENVN